MRNVDLIASVLLAVSGLNWGLVAVLDFDLVAALAGSQFGEINFFSGLIYASFGAAAIVKSARVLGLDVSCLSRNWSFPGISLA